MLNLQARSQVLLQYGKGKGVRSKEKTDKTWLKEQVSRAKKGCLRLLFEGFDKNGYFVKFHNFKSDFFGKETHYFILRFYKDNVNVTIENYKLERNFCISIIH